VEEAYRAARTMRRRQSVIDLDDLRQEALIYLATHPRTVEHCLGDPEKGLPYLGWHIRGRLWKVIAREIEHRSQTVSVGLLPDLRDL
jgi:hypothetical protein